MKWLCFGGRKQTKERINKNNATGSVVKMIRIIEGLWRVCETVNVSRASEETSTTSE